MFLLKLDWMKGHSHMLIEVKERIESKISQSRHSILLILHHTTQLNSERTTEKADFSETLRFSSFFIRKHISRCIKLKGAYFTVISYHSERKSSWNVNIAPIIHKIE
ncbi:unnamed protein product [Blepharisma stoltei]|uniref:Uncharacterized protein n=1 Tax=Blepharisma stoltei TaxID=1481888 RepID=A0AAU9KDT6_9CILI|nr:unnamed protein product [Blepharisma stoltei]